MFRLAVVLLLLLLTHQLVAQAKVATREEDAPTSKRTLFNIIWGCVSTTIICAWAAIHPNIPPREGRFKGALRRLELMFWTIVAPEILPCWALNQLLAAMTVRDIYNKQKDFEKKRCGMWETVKGWFSLHEIKEEASLAWTVAHGHFLIMGGFHVVEPREEGRATPTEANTDTENGRGSEKKPLPGGRVTILTLEMLEELVKDPEFEIQTTEEDITHTSKGDALSKIIFIMQSTWFILQCFGRRIQGLNLTHLELTTLALASLNGITFLLWWDKPLGAQAIVRVYLKRKLTDSERRVSEDRWEDRSSRSQLTPDLQKFFNWICSAFLCQPEGLVRLPFAILFFLVFPIFAFVCTLNDLVLGTSTSFPTDDTHVPTFYVPTHRYSKWYHMWLLITLGTIFGAIRCSGWNFPLPTYAEQKLWRAASLAVTVTPIATMAFIHILVTFLPSFRTFAVLTLLLCTFAYVVARLVLLGLALGLLRHLPSTAFIAIDWTRFYPHIL